MPETHLLDRLRARLESHPLQILSILFLYWFAYAATRLSAPKSPSQSAILVRPAR